MTITFNNIPTNIRTPGVAVEIDNSRALKGLLQNPHKVLILGQKLSAATFPFDTLVAISRENLADGYFGAGSILARMCNKFKANNPNTEVYAMAVGSGIGGTAATGTLIDCSKAIYSDIVSGTHTWHLMINGEELKIPITSGMSGQAIASKIVSMIISTSTLPITATVNDGSVLVSAVCSGTLGNYINFRTNYYDYQSTPSCFSGQPLVSYGISVPASGATDPDIGDAWAVIDNEQFHYVIQPYIDSGNLTEIEGELEDRFDPLNDLQGHGFTCVRGFAQASLTTLGNLRNSPHNTIIGMVDSPTCPEEWAAALGGVASKYLNIDPARPLHYLKLKDILPPPVETRMTRAERDVVLYDGIATFVVDSGGNVLIERCITTYQTNAAGLPDPSYLDIQTLATLGEIRYQTKARLINRFIEPRFKLADDGYPVQPGSYIATPGTVKQELISLFSLLRDQGLIENLNDFIDNLVVERDNTDRNRVNVLLPVDLINQFRILAASIQFIL